MYHIDVGAFSRINIENDDDAKIIIKKEGETDNWGDEDCIKMVTEALDYEIIIKAAVADKFKDVTKISFFRKDYYRPCYHTIGNQEKIIEPNGDIKFKRKE